VYPEVPNGHRLTTPGRIPVDEQATGELFSFGFAYLPGAPTATPRPISSMVCTSYPLVDDQQYSSVDDMLITPDGAVWGIASYHGAFRLDPANHTWTTYTEEDGLPPISSYSLSRAPSGELWFAGYNGVASFDGSSWTTHVTRDGLTSPIRDEVVLFGPDGSVWVAATDGAYKLDSETNQTTNFPVGGELRTYGIGHATQARDGTIWGTNGGFVFQLALTSTQEWTMRRIPDEYDYYRTHSIEGIAASSDGALWIGGTSYQGSGVIRFDPKTNQWTAYNRLTTNGALLGESVSSFAVAPDDSIWLGTERNGVIQIRPSPGNSAKDAEIVYHMDDALLDAITVIAFGPAR
jgi:streptogramin lyase